MRMTKTSKNNTAKITTTLPDSNPKTDISSQTPIEIALKIDENGMTSLKNLYSFLELEPKNYSRWCKRNITDNPFATEGIDYIVVRQTEERPNPKPTYEYKLTSDFAKQLSMTVKNERGQEARQYFIACEQGLKVAVQKLQSNPNNEVNEKLIELLTSMDNRLSKLEEQSNKKKLPEKKYSRWKTNTFKKLNALLFYVNENSYEKLKLSEIIHLVIGETEDTYCLELNDYVEAYKSEFDLDTTPYAIDVINHYKDIRDMFTLTLDSIMEKLHIAENTDCNKTGNIFNELVNYILTTLIP